jgi:hypothetical protein
MRAALVMIGMCVPTLEDRRIEQRKDGDMIEIGDYGYSR